MNCIKKLSPEQAQKIAAGQVVERPANIVKELLENSLDAGATHISLSIEDAGKKLIRVIDNGSGMNPQDALMCFEHHATSKIISIEDLMNIATFGFRGEALSSIASVSKVTLCTRMSDSTQGIQIIRSTDTNQTTSIACPVGTDITIEDLFYNVPARQKFLKTTETEWRQIMQLFHAFCFDYPEVHFKLINHNQEVLNCPATHTIANRIAQLWDLSAAKHMIPIDAHHEQKNIHITGMISDHQYTKYDRSTIYFLVNKRWVKNYFLSKALLKGYANVLPAGKYPAACIIITVAQSDLDINTHPRKEEVQFLQSKTVEQLVSSAVKKALEDNLSAQLNKKVTLQSEPSSFAYEPRPSYSSSFVAAPYADLAPRRQTTTFEKLINPLPEIKNNQPVQHAQQTITTTQDTSLSEQYHIVGQYRKTYILLEHEDGLYLVDQHAAHERVLYELFAKRFDQVATVRLLFPPLLTISDHDYQTLEPYLELLHKNGLELERWGPQELMIQSAPVHLKDAPLDDLITTFISWIRQEGHADKDAITKSLHEKLHAQMACKAAVKAGDTLTMSQMHQLLQDLQVHEHRFTCPHGRPTGWLLPLSEIEKKFKRRV